MFAAVREDSRPVAAELLHAGAQAWRRGVMRVIVGVGCDLVAIERLEAALRRRPSLAERLFTAAERAEGDRAEHLAGKFAAKEACLKAIGTGFAGCRWTDVEVLRPVAGGRPEVRLHGAADRLAAAAGVSRLHVSISHDGGLALAHAVAEG